MGVKFPDYAKVNGNAFDHDREVQDCQPIVAACPRILHDGQPCPNRVALRSPSRPQDGYLATCITHDHEDRYNADTFSYKGD